MVSIDCEHRIFAHIVFYQTIMGSAAWEKQDGSPQFYVELGNFFSISFQREAHMVGERNNIDSDADIAARLAHLEARVNRLDDIEAINKLTRAYGYYVDKKLWHEVVDLFSADCTIEIAGRGLYRGHEGADALFRGTMGADEIGLQPGALFNHMMLQGIVDIDGETAQARWRAFVQIARHGAVAIWSEGTYENRYVKSGEIWRISHMHFFATYYTRFDQGWKEGGLPNNGPSPIHPPEAGQTIEYDVFPGHFVPPFHYPNPVTGRQWTLDDSRRYSTAGMSPQGQSEAQSFATLKTGKAIDPRQP